MSVEHDFVIKEGKTLKFRVQWLSEKHIYVPIQSMSKGAPLRVVTQTSHNIKNGWPVAVEAAEGMTNLNSKTAIPKKTDYRPALLVSPTEVEFNTVVSASWPQHTAGTGFLRYLEPMPLVGTQPRWVVKNKVDGEVYLDLTVGSGHITINDVEGYYEVLVGPDLTSNLLWKSGVHEFEVVDPALPHTYQVAYGKVKVTQELATNA